jgi:hypothetical protein
MFVKSVQLIQIKIEALLSTLALGACLITGIKQRDINSIKVKPSGYIDIKKMRLENAR